MRDDTLPSKNEVDKLNFTKICEVRPGLDWVEINTSKQAECASRAGHTPVDIYFNAEAESELNKGRPAPHRWFMLASEVDGRIKGEVVMAAPGPGLRRRIKSTHVMPLHVVGFGNSKAFPTWAAEIEKLAKAVDIPMPPNYAGNPIAPTKGVRLAELLENYGWNKFRSDWLEDDDTSPECEAVRELKLRSRIGDLADGDAANVLQAFAAYGNKAFGDEWDPSDADNHLLEERSRELRSLLPQIAANAGPRLH
jgi:hypothetical protein